MLLVWGFTLRLRLNFFLRKILVNSVSDWFNSLGSEGEKLWSYENICMELMLVGGLEAVLCGNCFQNSSWKVLQWCNMNTLYLSLFIILYFILFPLKMVKIQRIPGPKEPAELTYYTLYNGKPLLGTAAAKILSTVDSQRMALTLGYVIQVQADRKSPFENSMLHHCFIPWTQHHGKSELILTPLTNDDWGKVAIHITWTKKVKCRGC